MGAIGIRDLALVAAVTARQARLAPRSALRAAATGLLLFANACGVAAQQVTLVQSEDSARAAASVRIIDDRGRSVTLAAPAQRIISLLPSLTESVCALHACDRLVGVDRSSDWPATVRNLPRLGGLEDPAIERIVGLRPDLVLVPVSWRATARLEAAGLTVVALEPASMGGTQRMLEVVARTLGTPGAAQTVWQGIQAQIDAAAASVPASLRGQRVYFEVSDAPHAAGEASVVGELLAALGMRNVVPRSMGAFPRLNPEFVVRASPQWIMGARDALARMPSRPGWAKLFALSATRTCAFTADAYDAIVRPGPRLGEAAQRIAQCLGGSAHAPASAPG